VTPGERYVVLGLAPVRAAWFRDVGRWANGGLVPCEFVRCVSVEELRARLGSPRPHSAVVVDAAVPGVDRDLIECARDAGCAVLVVSDGRVARDWPALGAAAVLPDAFDRETLVDALRATARPVGTACAVDDPAVSPPTVPGAWEGRLAMVCGPGGTGVSTLAAALAQGLADTEPLPGSVLLADLRRHAEQAMLHDAGDVTPGVEELVEAHRGGQPGLDAVRALTFDVVERRYRLLLGLRRANHWSTLRPRATAAGLASLRRAFRVVVCDCDADLEGEDDGGSADVEERNALSRLTAAGADVVFAVGLPSMKGLYSLARVVGDLVAFGVPPERVVPVCNRAPRGPRARAELVRTLAELLAPVTGGAGTGPVFVPDRRVESVLRDGTRLPASLSRPLAGAFAAVLARVGERGERPTAPVPVVPGSLGAWPVQEATGG
jgi:hypothetical protein